MTKIIIKIICTLIIKNIMVGLFLLSHFDFHSSKVNNRVSDVISDVSSINK